MSVDFRVRPPYKGFLASPLFSPRASAEPWQRDPMSIGRETPASYSERSMSAFIDEMDEAGIDLAVVMGRRTPGEVFVPNEDVAELVETYAGRIVGFGGADTSSPTDAMSDAERIVELGLIGVALDNGWSVPARRDDDPELDEFYAFCQENGLIVALTKSVYVGPELDFSSPSSVQRLATKFPDLQIVVVHGAWPWVTQMLAVAMRCTNVHVLSDFYGYLPNMPGAHEYLDAANSYLSHRTLYGSSYPVRSLGQSVRQFAALDFVDDETRQQCLSETALRLLRRR